jgi:rhomboid family protein
VILYELPHLGSAVHHASFYPCAVDGSCHAPEAWGISWFTAMFMHGSWDHILGNMLFLATFGKNVEDALGHLRYLGFYIAGGLIATMTQAVVTLHFGSASAAHVPTLGASGAIAAVLGAFIVLYPAARIRTLVLVFLVQIPAWVYIGGWFLYQLVEAHLGLASASANGGGVAFSHTSAASPSAPPSRRRCSAPGESSRRAWRAAPQSCGTETVPALTHVA